MSLDSDVEEYVRTRKELLASYPIEDHIDAILRILGYDPDDNPHFAKTPERAAKVLEQFAAGSDREEAGALLQAVFDDEHDSMVIVGPIKVTSMCAHHMLPVTGEAWVGYIPDGKVCGLSKLARVVHYYAQQLTVQERVTQLVATVLEEELKPLGVMVVIDAEHGCMTLRGVMEPNARTTTSAARGAFLEDPAARAEFMALRADRRNK